MLNNYMSNVSSTLAAMERLTRELNARPEPFVLILFGDHKPWMGNGNTGYTEIGAGFDLSQLSGFREYYSTPYLIQPTPPPVRRWATASPGRAATLSLLLDEQGYLMVRLGGPRLHGAVLPAGGHLL